jgi:hypothetical protein
LEIGEEIEAMVMLMFLFGVPMNGGGDDEG